MPPKKREKSGLRVNVDYASTAQSWKVNVWFHLRAPFAIFFQKVLETYTPKMLGVSLGVAPIYILWSYMDRPTYKQSDVFNTISDFVYRYLVAIASFGNPYTPVELSADEYGARGIAFYLGLYNYMKAGNMGKQFQKVAEKADKLAPVVYDYLAGRLTKVELEKFLGDVAEPVELKVSMEQQQTQAQAIPEPSNAIVAEVDDSVIKTLSFKPALLGLSWVNFDLKKLKDLP